MPGTDIMMGKLPDQVESNLHSIDLVITEECNLRCKYCYLVHKNDKNVMSLETAMRAVDFVLSEASLSNSDGVLWGMGGGEALLEIDLIDSITDYIKSRLIELDHPWQHNWGISICTNGILYDSPKVQNYLIKNRHHVGLAITIDGCKIKHDSSRVFPNGLGSYDIVEKNVKLWFEQFPEAIKKTKATFSHDDIKYLKDSVIHLWDIGIDYVMGNLVFEDVWKDGDDIIFEKQLNELADYIIENGLWETKSVRFFDPMLGLPVTDSYLNTRFCGSGKHMIAIEANGKITPCIRFTKFSLSNKDPLYIGDIYNGIDNNKLRAISSYTTKSISNDECINCTVGMHCSFCAGFNYDNATRPTVLQRATYHCLMHKANARACEYFWNKLKLHINHETPRSKASKYYGLYNLTASPYKSLLFMLSDDAPSYCNYARYSQSTNTMPLEIFTKGMELAREYNLMPLLLGNNHNDYLVDSLFTMSSIPALESGNCNIMLYDEHINTIFNNNICNLLISKTSITNLYDMIKEIGNQCRRLNIFKKDLNQWDEYSCSDYVNQLTLISDWIIQEAKLGITHSINILTDLLNTKSNNSCDAGESSLTLAPNGKFYICPAFYLYMPNQHIGSLEDGITYNFNKHLLARNSSICNACDACHCDRCKFASIQSTGEISVPSNMQCKIAHIERSSTRNMQIELKDLGITLYNKPMKHIDHCDPYTLIR